MIEDICLEDGNFQNVGFNGQMMSNEKTKRTPLLHFHDSYGTTVPLLLINLS